MTNKSLLDKLDKKEKKEDKKEDSESGFADPDDIEAEAPKDEAEIIETQYEEEPKQPVKEKFAITKQPEQMQRTDLASKEDVKAYLDMYNYIKKEIVDESDFQWYKGKPFMKKSGWRKFVRAFNISIETSEPELIETKNDLHAKVKAKAVVPNGLSVEAIGYKSKSEYWSEKQQSYGSYTLHNLIATARTRAVNIAISDLVGYGEVSAEEVQGSIQDQPTFGD